ncbi:MAG TPA: hypothetical protein VGB43_00595, partial [Flavobacterium sp.]
KEAVPHEFQTKAISASVARLQELTKQIHQMVVEKMSDQRLNTLIIQAHDAFHEIVGLCSKEPEHKH